MKVELIYFEGCPNAAPARNNLERAVADAGCGCKITEWKQGDAKAPDYIRHYGSPTILIDGKDIMGVSDGGADTSRLYEGGVPSVATIQAALKG